MKTYKIYGDVYQVSDTTSEAPDAYAFRGELCDDKPSGRKVGYVTMQDGSVIECYTKMNPIIIIIPVLLIVCSIAAIVVYLLFFQPKDVNVSDLIVKQGDDRNVVSYNGFMTISNDELSVNFQNGDYAATVTVTGEGIECDPFTEQPGEFVYSIPVTYTTESGLVQADITISTETSSDTQQVVVEIPENNTPNSPESGLEGYWKGEFVYGTTIQPAE